MQKSSSNNKNSATDNYEQKQNHKKHPIALIRGLKRVKADIQNIKDKDPAAKSILEILLLYPGFHAL